MQTTPAALMRENMAVVRSALSDGNTTDAATPVSRRRTRAALASLSALQLIGGSRSMSSSQQDQRDIEPCEGMLEVTMEI